MVEAPLIIYDEGNVLISYINHIPSGTLTGMESRTPSNMDQRRTQYTFADKCMESLIRNFTESQASVGVSSEDLHRIHNFLVQYEEDGSITDMPSFGDLYTPLPIKYGLIIGDAGTGKSTALKNIMFRDHTMIVVGTTNPACNNFISELAKISKPILIPLVE